MKKLALALVCLVSVAFFASCTPEVQNPEPSIAIMTGENFVYDGQTVDLGVTYSIGFRATSNDQTKKELAKFNLNASLYETDGTLIFSNDSIIPASGTEFVFQNNNLVFEHNVRELIGKAIFTATITDVDGKVKSTTLTVNINQPAQPLVSRTFEWYRLGNTITGLDEFGLSWKGNYPKDTYAKLVPQDGVKLFIFEAKDWNEVTTDLEKAAFFNKAIETLHTADEYFEVNVTQMDMTYNDVIGTIMPDGTCHLIHVTQSHTQYVAPTGTATTITGEAK